jgi:hypothetical protein
MTQIEHHKVNALVIMYYDILVINEFSLLFMTISPKVPYWTCIWIRFFL